MTGKWFPDFVAKWYDDFRKGLPYTDVDRWIGRTHGMRETYKRYLFADPHGGAVKTDEYIQKSQSFTEAERRFQALTTASDVRLLSQ